MVILHDGFEYDEVHMNVNLSRKRNLAQTEGSIEESVMQILFVGLQ